VLALNLDGSVIAKVFDLKSFYFHTVDLSTPSTTPPTEEEDKPIVLEAMFKTMPVKNASALNAIATEAPAESSTGSWILSCAINKNVKRIYRYLKKACGFQRY
jgi:hypothetical protein